MSAPRVVCFAFLAVFPTPKSVWRMGQKRPDWRDARVGDWVRIGTEKDVAPGKVACVRVGGRKVALFNQEGVYRAYDDYCTHNGGPLTQGTCEDGVVTCVWHGAQFRVSDGAPLTPPAGGRLRAYPLRLVDGVIEVEFDD